MQVVVQRIQLSLVQRPVGSNDHTTESVTVGADGRAFIALSRIKEETRERNNFRYDSGRIRSYTDWFGRPLAQYVMRAEINLDGSTSGWAPLEGYTHDIVPAGSGSFTLDRLPSGTKVRATVTRQNGVDHVHWVTISVYSDAPDPNQQRYTLP